MNCVIKQFIIYSTGAIILRLITAISVLYTIKFIPPDEFGVLALLNNLIVFLPIILGLGLRQVLAIEFFNIKNHWGLVWELLVIYLGFAIPAIMLLLYNLSWLNQILFLNNINPKLLILALLTCLINFFPELLFQLLRFQNRALLLAIIQILMGIMVATITIHLLVINQLGLASVIWAQLITQGAATGYLGYLLVKNWSSFKKPHLTTIITYLKIGLPFIPNILFAWLIMACNRWLLNWQSDLTSVGVYSLAENISLMFQTLITQPIMHSFLPQAFAKFNQNQANLKQIARQYNRFACWFILFFVITIPASFMIFKPILCYLLPTKYIQALPLITPLLIAQAIFAGTYITSASIQYRKKTHILAILMGTSAMISISINLWLIPTCGIYSCAIAANCAYLFYFFAIQALKNYFHF